MTHFRNSPDPRYGAWKLLREIELEDLLVHPVWLWCMQLGLPGEVDGPIGGDETSMRPLLQSDEVPLDHVLPPLILLRVSDTGYHAAGLYDPQQRILESITVFAPGKISFPAWLLNLSEPATYVAVPSIGGRRAVRFLSPSKESDEATQED